MGGRVPGRQAGRGRATLATIAEYANASATAGGLERDDANCSRGRFRLDAKGWEKASAACVRLVDRLAEIEASAEKRLAKNPHADGTPTRRSWSCSSRR